MLHTSQQEVAANGSNIVNPMRANKATTSQTHEMLRSTCVHIKRWKVGSR